MKTHDEVNDHRYLTLSTYSVQIQRFLECSMNVFLLYMYFGVHSLVFTRVVTKGMKFLLITYTQGVS